MIAFVLAGVFAALNPANPSLGGETVVARPVDDGRALCNPDMGWVMHYYDNGAKYGTTITPGDSLDWYPGCNVVYLRLPWSWLEPEVFVSVGEADGTPVFELPYGDADGHRRYRIGRIRIIRQP